MIARQGIDIGGKASVKIRRNPSRHQTDQVHVFYKGIRSDTTVDRISTYNVIN